MEHVTQPSPGAPITILGIAGATGQSRHFCVQIHDLLKKRVWVQVEPSKTEEGHIFKPLGFCQYFAFSCLIRNGTVMGPSDPESTQKRAPGDTQIIHFGQDPICIKITPLHLSTLNGNPLSSGNYIPRPHHGPARYQANIWPGRLPVQVELCMAWLIARESNTRAWQLAMKSVTSALTTATVCTLSNTGSCQAKVYLGNWDH